MKRFLSALFGRNAPAETVQEFPDPDPELERLLHQAVALQAQGQLGEAYECLRNWLRMRVRRGDRKARVARRPVEVPATTLVCVDCRDHELAAEALRQCLARCSFERAVFFTDRPMQVPGVETVLIDRIASVRQYSEFIIKGLDRHIRTEFALLVQYDGYILNADCWTPEFHAYDYIGARWPASQGVTVGNGGFSLRSKRLLRALQDPQIVPADPEDLAICLTYRPLLESRYGVQFAPEEVADRFSFETVPAEGMTFGFHGLGHLVNLFDLSDADIAAYRPPAMRVMAR